MEDIVIVGMARTPLGRFGGAYRDVPAAQLGAAAIRGALENGSVAPEEVDTVLLGNCRQAGNGPNPVRTAAVKAGIPISVPAATVNMACPSGMKSVMLASQSILTGESLTVVAGGMESMSTMPFMVRNVRWEGIKLGNRVIEDAWSDTIDPLCDMAMGQTAESLAKKYGISREEQDEFALESHQKAANAEDRGFLKSEIVSASALSGLDERIQLLDHDESIRRDTSLERLGRLKPAFEEGGSVTAGNSCSMGDGGVALVVTSRAHAKERDWVPLFSVVSFSQTGVEPAFMGDGPGVSIPLALQKAGMTLNDMEFVEVNEAFAVQMLANERVLGWDRSRVNVHGGAIAMSHPTGISGARILMSLYSVLRESGGELGVAGICGGGGVSTAMIIRRES
ncbi:MAG: thiolase family protein [Actinomycetota bacterium]|nr:thiolase family protein [Actinomycetota bacterium]